MAIHATRVIELVSSAQRSANGTSSGYSVGDLLEGRLYVDVTALSGSSTPTLTVTVQDSPDDGTTWFNHTVMSGITATGQTGQSLTNFGDRIRVSYTITGTFTNVQGFTFSIDLMGKD